MSTGLMVTPLMLGLTRRATLFGLPYNAFIVLLITGCVAVIWIDKISLVAGLLASVYVYFSFLCSRDMWALEICLARLQQLGVCPFAVKQYWGKRSYYPG